MASITGVTANGIGGANTMKASTVPVALSFPSPSAFGNININYAVISGTGLNSVNAVTLSHPDGTLTPIQFMTSNTKLVVWFACTINALNPKLRGLGHLTVTITTTGGSTSNGTSMDPVDLQAP